MAGNAYFSKLKSLTLASSLIFITESHKVITQSLSSEVKLNQIKVVAIESSKTILNGEKCQHAMGRYESPCMLLNKENGCLILCLASSFSEY